MKRRIDDLDAAEERKRQDEAKKAEAKRISDEAEKQRIQGQQAQKQKDDQVKADKDAIIRTLKEYETAYRNRDLNGIKGVFPTVPEKTVKDFFSNIRGIEVSLSPEEPNISGNDATVRCTLSYSGATTDGKRLPQHQENVRLRKVDGRWWIVALK